MPSPHSLRFAGAVLAFAPAALPANAAEFPEAATTASMNDEQQCAPTSALPADNDVPADTPDDEGGDIVVFAPSSTRSVTSDIPADQVLSEADIASYGASNASELIAALTVQTGSGRGRSGGPPVILVAGRRVSGFGEIRNLPPEAIERVEIFPEAVALDYGYSPDQRVINFILKPNFMAVTAEAEAGGSTGGWRSAQEAQASVLRIVDGTRINLTADYARNSAITEAERGIGQTDSDVRTLSPATNVWSIDGTAAGSLSRTIGASGNLRFQRSDSDGLLGRSDNSAAPALLQSDTRGDSIHAGTTLDGRLAKWRWSLTGNYDRDHTTTLTDRADLVAPTGLITDRSVQTSQTVSISALANGTLTELPAGRVRLTLQTGFDRLDLAGSSARSGTISPTDLGRSIWNGSVNVDVPLADADKDVLSALGQLSVNGRFALSNVSDFGTLKGWTLGAHWVPAGALDVVVNWIGADTAPTIAQLGAPTTAFSNQSIYDFTRGETVDATLLTGGNPNLLAERKRDFTATVNVRPIKDTDLMLIGTFARIRSTNTTAALPLLTPTIEAAFSDRVVRDANGQIVSVDQSPVNFASTARDQLRYGINFAQSIGSADQRGPIGEMGTNRGRRGGMGGGPGRGLPGMGGPGGAGGRWNIALFHTVKFKDEVTIARGVPTLDLLNGDAISASGGSSRHQVELEGGVFANGMGFRLNGTWSSATRVNASALTGSAGTLRYSPLLSVNARMFMNLGQIKSLVDDVPFFANSRIRLSVNNLFGDVRTVRDANGIVPIRYSPGYLDPAGRFIEFSFRKQF